MKNEKGMTYIMLLIVIVLIILVIVGVTYFVQKKYQEESVEDIRTDMLLIQGKIKVLAEKNTAKKEDATLQGRKVSDNKEDEKIKILLEKQVITEQEEHFADYYILEEQQLKDMGLENIKIKDDNYFIVNYKTDEVITTKPIEINHEEYYKLSQLKEIPKESTQPQNGEVSNEQTQNVEE